MSIISPIINNVKKVIVPAPKASFKNCIRIISKSQNVKIVQYFNVLTLNTAAYI